MRLWIARNKNKTIYAYDTLPIRNEDKGRFEARGKYAIYFPDSLFKELTWENSPKEVELKLVSEIVGVTESPLKTFPRVNEFKVGASYRR